MRTWKRKIGYEEIRLNMARKAGERPFSGPVGRTIGDELHLKEIHETCCFDIT
jgi:hypothetical protein